MRAIECDVLVVGAGGAGLRAAIAASDTLPGGKVLLATKGRLGKSGVTAVACSERMAFHATLPTTEPGGDDAWVHHAEDVYRIGGEVSDWDLAEVLARGSAGAFTYLDGLGVPFARHDGTPDQFLTDGSRYARACYTGPQTANHIEEALVRRLQETPVEVIDHSMLVDLLTAEGGSRVSGAMVLVGGEAVEVSASAVVLAAGGAGSAWEVNVFPRGMTGDGYAAAYRAGCELVNMEFIQFGLCSVRTNLACSGSAMRALPRMVNDLDEEFLPRYFAPNTTRATIYNTLFAKGASWPISYEHPSHAIDLAVYREYQAGRKVYLDFSRNPEGLVLTDLDWNLIGRFRNKAEYYRTPEAAESPLARMLAINQPTVEWLAARWLRLQGGERIEIANAAQHFQGGVKIRRDAGTSIVGLYAAGECAGGQHGANRPGGHSLLDSQVFGRIAGESAARFARARGVITPDGVSRDRASASLVMARRETRPAAEVRGQLQHLHSMVASVVRAPEEMTQGLRTIAALRAEGVSPDENGLEFWLETRNMLEVGEIVLTAANARRESRGPHLYFAHYDDPEPLPRDDATGKRYIVIRRGADGKPEAAWE